MRQLDNSKFLCAIEDLIKYARVKRRFFQTKAWVTQLTFDRVVALLPSQSELEKRLLGEAVDALIASAVPKASHGDMPGFFVSFKALKALEQSLKKDEIDWRIASRTRGDVPGADYWGIDD